MTDVTSVLVVANETLVGRELVDTLLGRAEQGPIRVAVVAPVTQPREGYVVYRDSRRAAAGRRLDSVLAALRLAGIPAHGAVVDDEPLAAVKDVLASEDVDEIVVCTHPETKSGWLRKNLVDEIRKVAGDRPVEHVVSDVSGRTGANVLVVANETVLGEPLLDRIRQRANESAASFLIVCPQSDPTRGEHPEAERRLRAALSLLRSEGLDVHGQIAHPDPFVATMEAVEDERIDEIIVSTFPGERSGWLRRDLVGRLRATGLPVQHVVVEELVGATHDRPRRALHGHDDHHGPPPANQSSRVDPRTLGMLLFIGSEIMLFGSFFAAYFFVRVVNPGAPDHWPPEPYHFPVFVAGVNTAILVTSSFTMHWALQCIKRGERTGFLAGMVLTFLMGLAFLLTQVVEYLNVGFNTGDGAFASVFFGLTGLHGAHVFVGLSLLLMVIIRGFRGHFSPEHHHGVELPGIYWHFVDVMWIVVYATVYLL